MLPLRFLQEPTILMGAIYAFGLSSTLAVTQYYVRTQQSKLYVPDPFTYISQSAIWFQVIAGASAAESGIHMLPLVVGRLVFSVATGFVITKLGRYKAIQCVAATMVLAGASVQSTVDSTSGSNIWIPALLLIGTGAGAGIACPFLSAQSVLQRSDISVGMALLTLSQDLGEALSVSIAQAIFLNRLEDGLKRELPRLDAGTIIGYGLTGWKVHVSESAVPAIMRAYSSAVRNALILTIVTSSEIVVAALLTRNHKLNN